MLQKCFNNPIILPREWDIVKAEGMVEHAPVRGELLADDTGQALNDVVPEEIS